MEATMTHIKFSDVELEALARVIDAATKTLGVKVLAEAGVVWALVTAAVEAKKEASE